MLALLVGSTLNDDLESKLTHRQVESDQIHEYKLGHKQRLVLLLVFLRPVYVFLAFTRLVTLENQGHTKKSHLLHSLQGEEHIHVSTDVP